MNLLVFGGKLLKETNSAKPINQGLLIMLLTVIKLQCHISIFEHIGQDFLKENFVDNQLQKLSLMPKDQQKISDSRV